MMDAAVSGVIPYDYDAGLISSESTGPMIWMYERGEEVLRLETRYDKASASYELIWHRPDGTHTVEQFLSETAYRVRLDAVERHLKTDKWMSSGPPQILKDGWRM